MLTDAHAPPLALRLPPRSHPTRRSALKWPGVRYSHTGCRSLARSCAAAAFEISLAAAANPGEYSMIVPAREEGKGFVSRADEESGDDEDTIHT